MVGAAETPYDLRFRFLGDPGPRPSAVLVGVGGAGLAGSQSAGGRTLGGLRFRFDPGPRVWARFDGESVSDARRRSSSGDWAACATARPNARRRCSAWPSS